MRESIILLVNQNTLAKNQGAGKQIPTPLFIGGEGTKSGKKKTDGLYFIERLLQIGNQIVHVLDTHRQAHQSHGKMCFPHGCFAHPGMGH